MNEHLRSRLKRLKTLPVFPTLLTAGNLACGITAVLCAASYVPGSPDHRFMLFIGAAAVFVAMIFDMFDGKVARMTRTVDRLVPSWTAWPTWCPSESRQPFWSTAWSWASQACSPTVRSCCGSSRCSTP